MSTPGGSLVIAQVFSHDHPDSGGDGDTSLLEEVLEPVPVRVGHADIADLEGTFGRCGLQAGLADLPPYGLRDGISCVASPEGHQLDTNAFASRLSSGTALA